ncbi:BadF/BadG/BcrA/BcrD ATPase family protein [Streptomyces polyrhachis]|uniref:BadF/BadG/BcrA/BcrD ATPase family protein n=1 Tax=Streptomyces polyrhachis TaxID=1282885 RepID=A0ABW2G776_9ACTN
MHAQSTHRPPRRPRFARTKANSIQALTLIAGTGAAAARITGHRLRAAADGCGWLAGDDGSGFWIAREGVRRALRALDGRGPATALLPLLAAEFTAAGAPADAARDLSPQTLRRVLVDGVLACAPPVRLARHSTAVTAAARAGDAVAAAILDEAADLLAECLTALAPRPGEPLVTVGGLIGTGGPLLPHLTPRLAALGLTPHPVASGLAGAVALAREAAKGR